MTIFYHSLTDTYVNSYNDNGFVIGESQYPAGWLAISTATEKKSVGLVEVVTEGEYKDERYFINTETLVGSVKVVTNTPRPSYVIDALNKEESSKFLIQVRDKRELILNRLSGIAISAYAQNDTATVELYTKTRESLLDITTDLPETLDELRVLIHTRYTQIIESVELSPNLKTAFNSVDM